MKFVSLVICLFFPLTSMAQGYSIEAAMFSAVYDLPNNDQELLVRIHPKKKDTYKSILDGKVVVPRDGKNISVSDITLVVNGKNGAVRNQYSTIANTAVKHVRRTTAVSGFDPDGEPVIYNMEDGTVRVVFYNLPPENHEDLKPINLGEFSKEFVTKIGLGMSHDDRDIFHIPKPNDNTVTDVKAYLESYRGS